MKSILALALLAVSLVGLTPNEDYTPKTTKVAIVPVVNLSGETWPELKTKQSLHGLKEITACFLERAFVVLPSSDVVKALADTKIDLTDEEQHRREVLYGLGEKLDADLVAFVLITDVDQRKVNKFFVQSTEGKAKMKIWLVDVKKKEPLLSAKVIEGTSKSGGFLEIGEKGSNRKVLAVANGIRKALSDQLSKYPVVQKVDRDKVGG